MICRKCGRELPEDARFCGACGTPVTPLGEFGAAPVPPPSDVGEAQPAPGETAGAGSAQVPPPVQPGYGQSGYGAYNQAGQGTVPPAAPSYSVGPAPAAPVFQASDTPLSVGQFLLQDLISIVPLVNIVLLIVWSFSDGTNVNRRNWARARLIWLGIGIALTIVLLIFFIAVIGASYGGVYGY